MDRQVSGIYGQTRYRTAGIWIFSVREAVWYWYAWYKADHSKNFSFLYNNGCWHLSPAYDLTYSNSIGGEHATTVNGNGLNPGMKNLLQVAESIKLDKRKARSIAEGVREKVEEDLREFIFHQCTGN